MLEVGPKMGLTEGLVPGVNPTSGEVPTVPDAPQNLAAETGTAQGEIELTWDAVSGATSYTVYYDTSSGVTAADTAITDIATNSLTIDSLDDNTQYYFKVSATNDVGESNLSDETDATTLVGIPQNITADYGDTKLFISWDAVSGATSYNLYYRTTAGVTKVNGTKITGVTSPATISSLTNGTTYYVIITAVNSNGESEESSEVSKTPIAFRPPTAAQLALLSLPHLGTPAFNVVFNAASNTNEIDEVASATMTVHTTTTNVEFTEYAPYRAITIAEDVSGTDTHGWSSANDFFAPGNGEAFCIALFGKLGAVSSASRRMMENHGTGTLLTGFILRTRSAAADGILQWILASSGSQTITGTVDYESGSPFVVLVGRTATLTKIVTVDETISTTLSITGSLASGRPLNFGRIVPGNFTFGQAIGWRGAQVGAFDVNDVTALKNHYDKFLV